MVPRRYHSSLYWFPLVRLWSSVSSSIQLNTLNPVLPPETDTVPESFLRTSLTVFNINEFRKIRMVL